MERSYMVIVGQGGGQNAPLARLVTKTLWSGDVKVDAQSDIIFVGGLWLDVVTLLLVKVENV